MFLTIKARRDAGPLPHGDAEWDLDHKGEFRGEQVGDTIVFERNGVRETLRPTNGDATGIESISRARPTVLTVKGRGLLQEVRRG